MTIINDILRCEECRHADAYGKGCIFGEDYPTRSILRGVKTCPHFQKKNEIQLEEQNATYYTKQK